MAEAVAEKQTEVAGLTPAEYARAKRVTIGYIYAKIWDGTLPARKVMGRWLIDSSALREEHVR